MVQQQVLHQELVLLQVAQGGSHRGHATWIQ